MLTTNQRLIKRMFDFILALLALLISIVPLLILIAILSFHLKKNGIYKQTRIGYLGKSFTLYKLRTLKGKHHPNAVEIKQSQTTLTSWLRATKIDELPQIFNILKGDMSWVGPRPDLPGYADLLEGEDRIILTVRPGLTGPATIKYKNEEALLMQQKNALQYNDQVIWPDKVAINKEYVKNWSFKKDIKYIMYSFY